MHQDPFTTFKAGQREGWALFAPLETLTTPPAGALVAYAGVSAGARVLDVACGTGVVAVSAARLGAKVSALDLAPTLLERAHRNAAIAAVDIEFTEGDVEALPFADASFDIVLSQFGHMFGPQPAITVSEMLRVLKPSGRIAFSTWPPELFTGLMFSLVSRYVPPPAGVPATVLWGDPLVVAERLGSAVSEIEFEREVMLTPCLSPQHYRSTIEATAAPLLKLVQSLSDQPDKLAQFRIELENLIARFTQQNVLRQHFLMTRAWKR